MQFRKSHTSFPGSFGKLLSQPTDELADLDPPPPLVDLDP